MYSRLNRQLAVCGPLLLTSFLCACSQRTTDPNQNQNENEVLSASSIRGEAAATLELQDLDSKTVRMRDFKGKVVLLNFWGTTCAPCKQEIPWLVEFQREFGPEGFQVIAISMYGEGPEVLKPYVAEHQMENFKVLIGNDQLMPSFGLVAFPTTFIIDSRGRYYARHEGLINRPEVEKELAMLLAKEANATKAE